MQDPDAEKSSLLHLNQGSTRRVERFTKDWLGAFSVRRASSKFYSAAGIKRAPEKHETEA